MLKDKTMFTPTMAEVLERQGYLKEAAQIYSHLLEEMPGHKAFREKLEEIQSRLDREAASGDKLPDLFDEWLMLASEYRQLKRLKALRRSVKRQDGEES